MCVVTNFALYLYFASAYQGQLGPCSIEYQMLQVIVERYESAKYPSEEQKAERQRVLDIINSLIIPIGQ